MQFHYAHRLLLIFGLLAVTAPALAQSAGQEPLADELGFVTPNVSLGDSPEEAEPDEYGDDGDQLLNGDPDGVTDTAPASVVSRKIKTSLREPSDSGNPCGCNGCDPCCGNCCPATCCGPCLPSYVARVSWLYMHRSRPRDGVLYSDLGTGTPLADAGGFSFGWNSGIDASLLFNVSSDWGLDVRYLWLDPYGASQNFITTGYTYNTVPPIIVGITVPGAFPFNLFYSSKFQSAEWNMRRNYGNFGLLGGFRWAQLDERMTGSLAIGGAVVESETWTTRNNLYGFQLGADGLLMRMGKLKVEGFGKAGIYANDTNSNYLGGPTAPRFGSAGHGQCAFLGELGAFGVYPITTHLSLRAGYQMFWLSGVALASDQVAATQGAIGSVASFTNAHGSVFYHGANAGLEWCW